MLPRMLFLCAVAGLLAASAAPAAAEGAIAIGTGARGPSGGFSVGMSGDAADRAEAEADAMKTCRGENRDNPNFLAANRRPTEAQDRCKILSTFHGRCAAYAVNGDQTTPSYAYGWAVAATSADAQSQAQTRCEEMRNGRGRACVARKALCDGGAG